MKYFYLIVLSMCLSSCSTLGNVDLDKKAQELNKTKQSQYYNPNCIKSHNIEHMSISSTKHANWFKLQQKCHGFTD